MLQIMQGASILWAIYGHLAMTLQPSPTSILFLSACLCLQSLFLAFFVLLVTKVGLRSHAVKDGKLCEVRE